MRALKRRRERNELHRLGVVGCVNRLRGAACSRAGRYFFLAGTDEARTGLGTKVAAVKCAALGGAPEVLESLPLSLHSAATLVSSPFPVFDIWRAHQYDARDERLAQIDLAKGSQAVLISRSGTMETVVTLLSPGDAALLTAAAGHITFDAACEAAVLAEPSYYLGSGLGNLVLIRALAEVPWKITQIVRSGRNGKRSHFV